MLVNQFNDAFDWMPVFLIVGELCLAVAAYLAARHFRSFLLYVAALGFLVRAFSYIVSTVMPLRFSMSGNGTVPPPDWVPWLQVVGAPIALLVAGIAVLVFVVRRGRSRGL